MPMLIRQNAPGQPVTFIDLGRARGRLATSPFQSMGGPLVVPTPKPTVAKPKFAPGDVIEREIARGLPVEGRHYERCGVVMKIVGVPCARRARHSSRGPGQGHRTYEAMQADNARRRARDFGA